MHHVNIGQRLLYNPPKQYGGLGSRDRVGGGGGRWARRTGVGVGTTGPGGVEAGEAGWWVGAGVVGPWEGSVKSTGNHGVEAGGMMCRSCYYSYSGY